MSDIAVQPAAAVDQWLASFDEALTAGDAAAAADLFARGQLLARPRRLHLEHQDGRGTGRGRGHAATRRSRARGRAAGASPSRRTRPDGVVDAWLEFETAVGRGSGHLRLKDGKAWTLLTDAVRAQGLRGAAGARAAARAPSTAPARTARPGWSARRREAESSATTTQPVRRDHRRRPGRHRARRAAAPARRADHHRRAQRAPRRLVAQALQVAVPARPGLVRPPALHQVPRELAGVLAQGQDRRLARDVHAGDGAQLLGLDATPRARTYDEAAGEWTVRRRARRAADITLRPKQLVLATGMSGQAERARRSRAWTSSRATSTTRPQHPGPDAYAGKKCVVIGSNNSAHDICAALWEDGADVTMVQRSSTHIVALRHADGHRRSARSTPSRRSPPGVTTEKADLIFASLPYRILHEFQIPLYDEMRERDEDFYDRLERGRLRPRLGRGRLRPVHEVPAPRLGLLHRRRRLRARRRRRREARQRGRSTT